MAFLPCDKPGTTEECNIAAATVRGENARALNGLARFHDHLHPGPHIKGSPPPWLENPGFES
jgi:hypothetical protein